MKDMTPDAARAFLTTGTKTGKLATVRPDGRPHVAPIWFVMDGDDLVFMTWHTSVKAANMKAESRVSLCVDDEKPPFEFVIVEGTVSIDETPDPAKQLEFSTRIAQRYMGDENAEKFGKRNAVEGEYLIRLTPTKILAKTDITG